MLRTVKCEWLHGIYYPLIHRRATPLAQMLSPLLHLNEAPVELERIASYTGRIRYLAVPFEAAAMPKADILSSKWEVASPSGLRRASAVCWLAGRNIFDALGGSVHIGLISAAVGSSGISRWMSLGADAHCSIKDLLVDGTLPSALWNGMVAPLTVGPLALKGILWYQGERDRGQPRYYVCAFPALIEQWRTAFESPGLFFGFVELAPCGGNGDIRSAQRAALALPNVGCGTAADAGDPTQDVAYCLHPKNLQAPAARLSASALALAYGKPIVWQQPTFEAAEVVVSGPHMAVEIRFDPVSLAGGTLEILDPVPTCPQGLAEHCDRPEIVGSSGAVYNATLSLSLDGTRLVFNSPRAAGEVPVAVKYAFSSWPIHSVYSTHRVTTRYESVRLPVVGFSVLLRDNDAVRMSEPPTAQLLLDHASAVPAKFPKVIGRRSNGQRSPSSMLSGMSRGSDTPGTYGTGRTYLALGASLVLLACFCVPAFQRYLAGMGGVLLP